MTAKRAVVWIANRRCLAGIIAEMEKVGQQAAEILLQQTPPDSGGNSGRVHPPTLVHPVTSPLSSSGAGS